MGIFKKNFILALVLAVCLSTTGCVKEGGVSPKVLEGKWNAIYYDGPVTDEDIYWEFEEDGDFKYCYDNYCYEGDWEWNKDKSEIDITVTDDYDNTFRTEFDVEVLDKTTLKGTWSFLGSGYEMEFERD